MTDRDADAEVSDKHVTQQFQQKKTKIQNEERRNANRIL